MSIADDIRDFAFDMVRTQSKLMQSGIPDSPTRTACLECEVEKPAFESLPVRAQLDIAETVCRREPFFSALDEALVESDKYRSFMHLLLDSAATNADVGRMAREIVLEYLQKVAIAHMQDLADFA